LSTKKKKFSPKNQSEKRVANNAIDLQNDFHEDRLSFPIYGENINLAFFEARRTKSQKFLPTISLKGSKIGR
jgi:hypothetical protein